MSISSLFKQWIAALTSIISPKKHNPKKHNLKKRSQTATPTATKQSTSQQKTATKAPSIQPLFREIRAQRKFTIAEAIGREGSGLMKGESAIPRPLRAIAQMNQFITQHTCDPSSCVITVLQTWAKEDIRVSRYLDNPLVALIQILESLLNEPATFQEFCRQVAIAQSQITGDRPQFQKHNHPPNPNAIYTHESVKQQLLELLCKAQENTVQESKDQENAIKKNTAQENSATKKL